MTDAQRPAATTRTPAATHATTATPRPRSRRSATGRSKGSSSMRPAAAAKTASAEANSAANTSEERDRDEQCPAAAARPRPRRRAPARRSGRGRRARDDGNSPHDRRQGRLEGRPRPRSGRLPRAGGRVRRGLPGRPRQDDGARAVDDDEGGVGPERREGGERDRRRRQPRVEPVDAPDARRSGGNRARDEQQDEVRGTLTPRALPRNRMSVATPTTRPGQAGDARLGESCAPTTTGHAGVAEWGGDGAQRGRMTSVPRVPRSGSGTTTEPSGCWYVSRIAATTRGQGQPGPVQRVDELRLRAGRGPVADRHPAGLVVAEVRAGGDLQPALDAGRPDLEVVLLGLHEAHVAGRHEEHPVGAARGAGGGPRRGPSSTRALRRWLPGARRGPSRPCRTGGRAGSPGCPCRPPRPRAGSRACRRRSGPEGRPRRRSRRGGGS